MNTQEIANRLVQLCRDGRNLDAINELYADNIVSIEPEGSNDQILEGKEVIIEKNKKWFESLDKIHSISVAGPLVTGTHFTCTINYDIDMKGFGRMNFDEVCVYEVKDEKIITEHFFYRM